MEPTPTPNDGRRSDSEGWVKLLAAKQIETRSQTRPIGDVPHAGLRAKCHRGGRWRVALAAAGKYFLKGALAANRHAIAEPAEVQAEKARGAVWKLRPAEVSAPAGCECQKPLGDIAGSISEEPPRPSFPKTTTANSRPSDTLEIPTPTLLQSSNSILRGLFAQ